MLARSVLYTRFITLPPKTAEAPATTWNSCKDRKPRFEIIRMHGVVSRKCYDFLSSFMLNDPFRAAIQPT